MKALWFDDEHETLESFKEDSLKYGIELIGYTNAKEGLTELKKNFHLYDAIILDGFFYEDLNQLGEALDNSAFGSVALTLKSFKDRGFVIPWFIFSGQPSFVKEKNTLVKVLADRDFAQGQVFEKNDEGFNRMCEEILKAVNENENTIIKNDYSDAFEVCTQRYIGLNYQKQLIDILKAIKQPKEKFNDELYFSQIRLILEELFRTANRFGLLHDACISSDGKVNLSESSLFLAGEKTKHIGASCSNRHFPKIIADSVKSIIFITGSAAHTDDLRNEGLVNLHEYRSQINTPYLLYSLTFKLLDVLVWFKSYVDLNPDFEQNKMFWKETSTDEWITGTVTKIAENGWGTFQPNDGGKTISIPPSMVMGNQLKELDIIEIKTKLNSTGTKTHIDSIKNI